jgi:hypothetical protein
LFARSFLISCPPICQYFLLVDKQLEFYLISSCLCLIVPLHSLLFCTSFNVSGITLMSINHFELILYRMRVTEVVSGLYMQISNFPRNISWRGCIFAIVCFWHPF